MDLLSLIQQERHLYANCFFDVLNIHYKYLLFHFIDGCSRVQITIITRVQKGRISGYKNGHILLKGTFEV